MILLLLLLAIFSCFFFHRQAFIILQQNIVMNSFLFIVMFEMSNFIDSWLKFYINNFHLCCNAKPIYLFIDNNSKFVYLGSVYAESALLCIFEHTIWGAIFFLLCVGVQHKCHLSDQHLLSSFLMRLFLTNIFVTWFNWTFKIPQSWVCSAA